VPRSLFGKSGDWRQHMEETRRAAVRLAMAGKVLIEQKGAPVDVIGWNAQGRPGIIRVRLLEEMNEVTKDVPEPCAYDGTRPKGTAPPNASPRARDRRRV
jgi:homogentisate 1,2-dioxygenase